MKYFNGLLKNLKRNVKKTMKRNSAIILCYHGVYSGKLPFEMYVQIEDRLFKDQMQLLSDHYECISIGDLVTQIKNGKIHGNPVVVTFDDGLSSNYKIAFPILEKYSIPATFYVCADLIGTSEYIWSDKVAELLMTTNEKSIILDGKTMAINDSKEKSLCYREILNHLKEKNPSEIYKWITEKKRSMKANNNDETKRKIFECFSHMSLSEILALSESRLVNIGSHGLKHSIFSRITLEEAKREIIKSKVKIETLINKSVDHFAYPNGELNDFCDEHENILINSGYESVATTEPKRVNRHSNIFRLPRICIGNDSSEKFLDFLLTN